MPQVSWPSIDEQLNQDNVPPGSTLDRLIREHQDFPSPPRAEPPPPPPPTSSPTTETSDWSTNPFWPHPIACRPDASQFLMDLTHHAYGLLRYQQLQSHQSILGGSL